jgi:hypothetical protein
VRASRGTKFQNLCILAPAINADPSVRSPGDNDAVRPPDESAGDSSDILYVIHALDDVLEQHGPAGMSPALFPEAEPAVPPLSDLSLCSRYSENGPDSKDRNSGPNARTDLMTPGHANRSVASLLERMLNNYFYNALHSNLLSVTISPPNGSFDSLPGNLSAFPARHVLNGF